MNGCAAHLYAVGESRLVHVEAVEACTAEGGDKRGMDVYYSVLIVSRKALGENAHKACKDDEVDAVGIERIYDAGLEVQSVVALLFVDNAAFDAGILRTLERICAGLIGKDEGYLAAFDDAGSFCIDKRLKIP